MTKRRKINISIVLFLISILLAACFSDQPAETSAPTSVIRTPKPTVILPDELFRISGEGAGIAEETFTLTEETPIRVSWDQSSEGKFVLVLFNLDPEMEGTQYGRVTFEYFVGPSSGYGDYILIPGEYGFEVEQGDGPWEVWIQEITNEGG